jgi:hypothetical protein
VEAPRKLRRPIANGGDVDPLRRLISASSIRSLSPT